MDMMASAHADPLARFLQDGKDNLQLALLGLDNGLLQALQARLSHHGLLDPPADGYLGPVTTWALAEFCRAAGLPFEGALSREAAEALLRAEPILPLRPGDDLPGRVVQAMLRRGDWVCRHPDCLTVAYVEGMGPDGAPRPRRPDAFDDARLLIRVEEGRPVLAGIWVATTSSGRDARKEPVDELGPPRLEPGQYKAWVIGRTAIGTELEQEALVQAAPLPVRRDADLNDQRQGDPQQTGYFVVDQHGSFDRPRDAVGEASTGCLVGQAQADHAAFMRLLRTDARWRANNAYRFTTSLLTGL